MSHNPYTRRTFLQTGLTLLSTAVTVPTFLSRAAFGLAPDPTGALLMSSLAGVPQDRILVVVQLAGGNDGLNTVVPFGMDAYYRARPGLAVPKSNALPLSGADGLGFHPNLSGLMDLYDRGLLSVIQGVGYPNPNRSHFTSTDIWSTGDPERPNGTGWIGRYFDCTCNGQPEPTRGMAIGRTAPHAMIGDSFKPVSFETPDLFRWLGEDVDPDLKGVLGRMLDESPRILPTPLKKAAEGAQGGKRTRPSSARRNASASGVVGAGSPEKQIEFLTRTTLDARVSSEAIRKAVEAASLVQYPGNPLSSQLRMVGAMIRAELPTRVYYVSLGGFDTHAGQAGPHANLMSILATSLKSFYDDLKAQGNEGRVLTMTFSEFGRRVGQNASGGTDHGTAAPMMLCGPMVRPGVIGVHPSLTDLDEGDLKYGIDFRNVYAGILDGWMKAPVTEVLGGPVKPAKILKLS